MGTIKIGSAKDKKGITVNPIKVLFNTKNVKKIISGSVIIWESIIALIPVMTSNTTPSGIASASHNNVNGSTAYAVWRAFNGTNTSAADCWSSETSTFPEYVWLQYKFTSAKVANKMLLANRLGGGALKNFKIQGSNNGTSWDDLGSFTNANATNGAEQYFEFNNEIAYLYYRLYITSSYSNFVAIAKWQLYGY